MPLWVEVVPSDPAYAMRYAGDGIHEIAEFGGSMERFSPADVAAEIQTRLEGRDLDGMWQIARVTPALPHHTPTVRQDDPLFTPKVVAALMSPRAGTCHVCSQPMHWLAAPTGGWWAHDVHPDDGHDARATPRTGDSRGECTCAAMNNPPCHWCSTTCCAEHIDVCLAGFPPPCCDGCPDES